MAKADKLTILADYVTAVTPTPEVVRANSYLHPQAKKQRQHTHYIIELKDFSIDNDKLEPKNYHVHEQISLDYYTESFHTMHLVHREFSRRSCREGLWKRAVENLYRRINFLELTIDCLNEYVSEDEFEEALTTREDEYVISFRDIENNLETEAIYDIVRVLEKPFDVHEVAELFGVEEKALYNAQAKSNSGTSRLLGLGS